MTQPERNCHNPYWNYGFNAYHNGISLEDNPYSDKDSETIEERYQWSHGWLFAESLVNVY